MTLRRCSGAGVATLEHAQARGEGALTRSPRSGGLERASCGPSRSRAGRRRSSRAVTALLERDSSTGWRGSRGGSNTHPPYGRRERCLSTLRRSRSGAQAAPRRCSSGSVAALRRRLSTLRREARNARAGTAVRAARARSGDRSAFVRRPTPGRGQAVGHPPRGGRSAPPTRRAATARVPIAFPTSPPQRGRGWQRARLRAGRGGSRAWGGVRVRGPT